MLIDCIRSIKKTLANKSFYLLLLDNGTHISVRRLLQNHLTMNKCYHQMSFNKQNAGVPKSWNQIINTFLENDVSDMFDFKYLCLLNSDVICQPPFTKKHGENPPSWLDELIAALEETDSDMAFSSSKGNCFPIQNYDPAKERFYVTENEELTGYCFLMTKSTIEKYGKFNESYGIGMFEETEYIHNMRKNGGKVVVANHSHVQHLGGKTFNSIMSITEYCRLFEVNKQYFLEKSTSKKRHGENRPEE